MLMNLGHVTKSFIFIFVFSLSFSRPFSILYAQPEEIIIVNTGNDNGMFATFICLLGVLDAYDSGEFGGVKVNFNYGRYLAPEVGSNWFEYFFEPLSLGGKELPKRIITREEYYPFCCRGYPLSRMRSFELISKFIHPKKEIEDEVNDYVLNHFEDSFVIGLHYRGTDKVIERPLVKYETAYKSVCEIIDGFPLDNKIKVYVATDDSNFISYIVEKLGDSVIYNNFVRSANGKPLHMDKNPLFSSQYQSGKEAVMDCLLLSKCNILLRPESNLSHFAARLNPYMPVIALD